MTSTYNQNYSSQYSSTLQDHVLFSSPNVYHDAETNHDSSSPASLSTRDFFSSINDHHQEYSGSYYHKELQHPQIQLDQVHDHAFVSFENLIKKINILDLLTYIFFI